MTNEKWINECVHDAGQRERRIKFLKRQKLAAFVFMAVAPVGIFVGTFFLPPPDAVMSFLFATFLGVMAAFGFAIAVKIDNEVNLLKLVDELRRAPAA